MLFAFLGSRVPHVMLIWCLVYMRMFTVTLLQKKISIQKHCFHSALMSDIITSISDDEHKLLKVLVSHSWVEFLQNKTIYHTCSTNITDILLFFLLAWKGRGHTYGTSYWLHNMHFLLIKILTRQVLFIVSTVDENYLVSHHCHSMHVSHWFNLFLWSLFYCTQFSITGEFWLHNPQFWCFKIE
jgi:hypothetical protein